MRRELSRLPRIRSYAAQSDLKVRRGDRLLRRCERAKTVRGNLLRAVILRQEFSMAEMKSKVERPLSPHLQIYRPMLTMMLSIVHRITGAALYFGTVLLVWWLVALASGPEYFDYVQDIAGSVVGRLVLFGYTWALVHHALGGLRHLVWDTGRGFDLATVERVARAMPAASVIVTLLLWVIGYQVM
jgi:succinate dehydrogenase / fumarate reductase cytochrome b subunit